AIAAIRSCGGDAFVTNAPRSLGTGVRSALRIDPDPHYSPKSRSNLVTSHRGVSIRTVSSYGLRSALQPLVVCGPSGVGKGTIISRFMEGKNTEDSMPSGIPKFGFSVSHTTRQPRDGEIDGVHYHFVSREYMLEKIKAVSFFIEHAEVHGNLYGTSFQSISDVANVVSDSDNTNQQCLLDIDVEGVRSMKEFQSRQQEEMKNESILGKEGSSQHLFTKNESSTLPELNAKFIFIAPPSLDVLRERLVGRGTETPETLERRFQNAKSELEYGMQPGNFDAIVVNDDLDKACAEFEKVVKEMYVW
ncbi:hypothetical protein ACHAXR_000736, partial [Thalassiosira sp. AJA248-18]